MKSLFVLHFISLAGELGECEAVFEGGDDEVGSSVAGFQTSGLLLIGQEPEFFSDGVNESVSERDTM